MSPRTEKTVCWVLSVFSLVLAGVVWMYIFSFLESTSP